MDTTQQVGDAASHLADRAVQTADQAVDTTRQAANAALDTVTDSLHAVHAKVGPTIERVTVPLDQLAQRTREQPIQTLLMAAAAGAALMVLLGLVRGR